LATTFQVLSFIILDKWAAVTWSVVVCRGSPVVCGYGLIRL